MVFNQIELHAKYTHSVDLLNGFGVYEKFKIILHLIHSQYSMVNVSFYSVSFDFCMREQRAFKFIQTDC